MSNRLNKTEVHMKSVGCERHMCNEQQKYALHDNALRTSACCSLWMWIWKILCIPIFPANLWVFFTQNQCNSIWNKTQRRRLNFDSIIGISLYAENWWKSQFCGTFGSLSTKQQTPNNHLHYRRIFTLSHRFRLFSCIASICRISSIHI